MNQPLQGQDLYAYLDNLYKAQLGRTPDTAGMDWWMQNAPQYLQQGGTSRLEEAFTGAASAYPVDQQYVRMQPMVPNATDLTRQEAVDWDAYMTRAANEQRGMALMPFVAPSTANLQGMHPDHIWQTYYRSPEEQRAVETSMQEMWPAQASKDKDKKSGGLGGLGGFKAEGLLGSKV